MRERKPGHLYVLLALYRPAPDHVEQFIEVETHEGVGVGGAVVPSFDEGRYRCLEFPHPDALTYLRAFKTECNRLREAFVEAGKCFSSGDSEGVRRILTQEGNRR
jgi:hypothetical protein